MNLMQLYRESQLSKVFNKPDVKGIITVNGFSFDIRLVSGKLYCHGLEVEDFFSEAMLNLEEQLQYEEAIYDWLKQYQAA